MFIVLEVGSATVTKESRVVRTFKVGDPTACINVSVWDEPGNLLAPGDIVRLTKGYASIWRQCLTLYSGKNGDIHKIGDFCLNFNEHVNMSDPNLSTMQPGAFTALPLGQKNQATPSPTLANNGSSNGNSVILSVTTTPTTTVPAVPATSNATPAVPAPAVKITGSNRNTASEHSGKASTGKTSARGSRNNQSRASVKSDRR